MLHQNHKHACHEPTSTPNPTSTGGSLVLTHQMFFCCRQGNDHPAEAAAKPAALPSRPALNSLMDDDWMFGCQKPEASSSKPTPGADAPPERPDTAPATSLVPTMHFTGEGSNSGQLLTVDRQLSLPEAESVNPYGQSSSARPWSMPVPSLRSSISFANALPPIATEVATQQQEQQQTAPADDVSNPESEQRKLPQPERKATPGAFDHMGYTALAADASVSDWLLQQVGGELLPSFCGGGNSMAEAATAGAEQGEASASSGATDAEAMRMQVRNIWQGVSK